MTFDEKSVKGTLNARDEGQQIPEIHDVPRIACEPRYNSILDQGFHISETYVVLEDQHVPQLVSLLASSKTFR